MTKFIPISFFLSWVLADATGGSWGAKEKHILLVSHHSVSIHLATFWGYIFTEPESGCVLVSPAPGKPGVFWSERAWFHVSFFSLLDLCGPQRAKTWAIPPFFLFLYIRCARKTIARRRTLGRVVVFWAGWVNGLYLIPNAFQSNTALLGVGYL